MSKSLIIRMFFAVICSLFVLPLFAQDIIGGNEGMESVLRSHDKIYVVMTVCLVILIVLILYLVSIDRKISRKEREG